MVPVVPKKETGTETARTIQKAVEMETGMAMETEHA